MHSMELIARDMTWAAYNLEIGITRPAWRWRWLVAYGTDGILHHAES